MFAEFILADGFGKILLPKLSTGVILYGNTVSVFVLGSFEESWVVKETYEEAKAKLEGK